MFDDYTRDILTIIGLITGIGLGFYGLDKNKQTKVLAIGYLFVVLASVMYNIYNIYNFFNLELTHKNIFTLVISVISLVLLTVTYFFVRIINISVKQLDFSSKQNDIIEKVTSNLEKHLGYIELTTESVIVLRDILHEIDEKEFQRKYKNTIEKIDRKFKNLAQKNS